MSGDQHLAVIGASAGVGSFVGGWVALWWRDRVPRGIQWLIHRIYKHVDDLIGATKNENQDRADRRRKIIQPRLKGWRWMLRLIPKTVRQGWADYREPIPRLGAGANPLPEIDRMAQYVHLELVDKRRIYHLWDVVAVTVFWTSEAAALVGDFPKNVGRKVAQALRLESVDQLEWTVDYDRGCIRYARKAKIERVAVPAHVPAREPV